MLYKCSNCNYTTKRACDLRRHQSRKYPCNRESEDKSCNRDVVINVPQNTDNVPLFTDNVPVNTDNVSIDTENVSTDTENVKSSKYKCSKCNKGLHERIT